MPDKTNKTGSTFDADGNDQAVENQSTVTPDDYPDTDGGKHNYTDRESD